MLFNSLRFLFLFLPAVLLVASRLKGRSLMAWICAASAVFYAYAGHAWFLIPMAITTLLDFWVGRRIHASTDASARRRWLVLSLGANLGLLAYFKYGPLLARSVESISDAFGVESGSLTEATLRIALPAGISFYTFQTMSYVIDIYRKHSDPEPDFLSYLAFVTFFPHLVAGPLTRHDQLLPQLHRISKGGIAPRAWSAVFAFSMGLCKKVAADRIANLIDPMIADVDHLGATTAALAAVGYALQIYFDFSGYSDMAIGLGRAFGIELPQNFDSPYQSVSPSDFWRRWHMTLSQWLRDYLYISLGGNRASPGRVRFNLLATMVLGGLWHGASWTFAAWGLFHGVLLVVHQLTRTRWDAMPIPVQRALTFVLVCIGWIFFRATSFHAAQAWFFALFGGNGLFGAPAEHVARLCIFVVLGLAVVNFTRNTQAHDPDAVKVPWRAALGLATAVAIIMMNYSSRFLYFQF